MSVEDYQMEQERRLNTLTSEFSAMRENNRLLVIAVDKIQTSLEASTRETKQGFKELEQNLQKNSSTTDRIELTLKSNIDAQIDAKLAPLLVIVTGLRDNMLMRNAQIAVIAAIATVIVTYLMKIL